MRKEASSREGAGTKRTSRSAGPVHSKLPAKRASSEGDSEKKRKTTTTGVVATGPAGLPLAVVVVEVQTSQTTKTKAGIVESKVKKKSVTLKATVPVKKLAGHPPTKKIGAEPDPKGGKQTKQKKDSVSTLKTPKIKLKKVDDSKLKKPVKIAKGKVEKQLTKKQLLLQQTQQKKLNLPGETIQTTPLTVVITEQDSVDKDSIFPSGKKIGAKLVKKRNYTGEKKVSVASGKIGKRKKEMAKKVVAKQAGKAMKKEAGKCKELEKPTAPVDPPAADVPPESQTVQAAKKPPAGKKAKAEDKRDTSPVSVGGRDLSPLPATETSKPVAKNSKAKPPDKTKQQKVKKKPKLMEEEETKKCKSEVQTSETNNDNYSASEVASKTEPKTKDKAGKAGSKVEKPKKQPAEKKPQDSKSQDKKAVEAKAKKPKPDNKKVAERKPPAGGQQPKQKGKQVAAKQKKGAKVARADSEKNSDGETNGDAAVAEHHSDSSTSDEIPLELIKQKCKQQAMPDVDSKDNIAICNVAKVEDTVTIDGTDIKIKQEVESQSSCCESLTDRYDDRYKNVIIKKEPSKESSGDNKVTKTSKKDDLPKKLVAKNTKKGAVKSTVKVGVKGKKQRVKKAKMVTSDESNSDSKSKSKVDSSKSGSDSEKRARRMKLFGFWSGPKRHRVASLNAAAKVHCLYENESRGTLLEFAEVMPRQTPKKQSEPKATAAKETKTVVKEPEPASTRTLRSGPGKRSVGRHYDVMNASSTTTTFSSSEESSDASEDKNKKKLVLQPSVKQKQMNRARQLQQEKKKKEKELQLKKQQQQQQSTDATSEEEAEQKSKNDANKGKSSGSSSSEKTNADGTRKVKKRRKRNELVMDLKDMVVRKRMASLNASAILAASYSMEKRSSSSSKGKDDSEEDSSRSSRPERKRKPKSSNSDTSSPDMEVEESSGAEDVLIRGGGSKQKVAVIVNQDTDVTITGVYVNSTTRSTLHEGFCSIAGMQYRISSTSHTQTEATAVATETVLHADHPVPPPVPVPVVAAQAVAPPCKSYTPLGALSSMQPPGHNRPRGPPSPLAAAARRHSCSSAFTAPPPQQDPAYVHGYYQPAGPLISHHHHHHSTTTTSSSASSVAGSKAPPPATLPTPTPPPSASAPQHPASESASDNEVVISSSSSEQNPAPPVAYRYPGQPPYAPPYQYQYYPSPPATASLQYPAPQQSHYHQEICYTSPSSYAPPTYFHHKAAPYPPPPPHPGYHRRYVPPPHPYYPQDFYPNPPNPPPPPAPSQQQQMIVTAPPPPGATTSAYPPPPADPNYPPPTAPMVDGYPPPPSAYNVYPTYSTGPPPACYSHSPPSRGLAFIDATYQGCPCPMQSCPKNVHTGPLTGASKGSLKNHQSTTPLPPVALALPLEPPGALGPPSPARGSAGMPPPPSPALATARNPPNQWNDSPMFANSPDTGLLAISKVLSESVLGVPDHETNGAAETLIALSMPKTEHVKIEVEEMPSMMTEMPTLTPEFVEMKAGRKRRKLNSTEVRRVSVEMNAPFETVQIKTQPDVQERLAYEGLTSLDSVTDKQLPVSDDSAAIATAQRVTSQKRKLSETENSEPLSAGLGSSKCAKKKRVDSAVRDKRKCSSAVTDKESAEENVEPAVNAAKPKARRRSSKVVERRKSSNVENAKIENTIATSEEAAPQLKKINRGRKSLDKAAAPVKAATAKGRKPLKNITAAKGGAKKDVSPVRVPTAAKRHQSLSGVSNSVAELSTECTQIVSLKRTHPTLKWSNGWSWEGVPYRSKVFITSDDLPVVRKCYPAMRHIEGDVISPRDCVLLKAGPRKIDLPFVAKVAAMWENPEDGEMMVSLLWYYRPEHTDQGRRPEDNVDEIFASRHKDINSVACIEDKCFVLTFNEYCRYRKSVRRAEEGLVIPSRVVPVLDSSGYPRAIRQPPGQVATDLVFFCRRVYDFRQRRILKNPS